MESFQTQSKTCEIFTKRIGPLSHLLSYYGSTFQSITLLNKLCKNSRKMALENNFAHILKDQKEIIIAYKIDPEYDQFGNCYKYSTYVILNKHILPFVEIVVKCYSVDRSVLAFLKSLDNEDRFPLVVYSKLNMFQNFEYNIQKAAERKCRFIPNINSDNAPHILKFPKENQPTWILGTAKFEGIVFVKLYN